MQQDRLTAFWNNLYESTGSPSDDGAIGKEWILHPTPALLQWMTKQVLGQHSQLFQTSFHILEVGCGSSNLMRKFHLHLQDARPNLVFACVATDVSPVCIQHQCEKNEKTRSGSADLSYEVLDIVKDERPEWHGRFDLILDKGCLDTLLFRQRHRGPAHLYPVVAQCALDHIYSWLRLNVGMFMVLSPRKKFPIVRDFTGFCGVTSEKLDLEKVHLADLEGDSHGVQRAGVYCHTAFKNIDYDSCKDQKFRGARHHADSASPTDSDTCTGCNMTFYDYRKGEDLNGRGIAFWYRRWTAHCKHCRPC